MDQQASRAELPSTAALRPDFIWGVSTSAFQIEGATHEGGRGPSVWDTYGHKGLVANSETGDMACDHYHRYREDVRLMRQLGIQAYRFSVAWPRILPLGRGAPNEEGFAFYDRLIDALDDAGIEPWLCLFHWDLPQALEDSGGWTSRDCVGWFADYALLVAKRYGSRVTRFATMNEPSIFTLFARGFGGAEGGASDGSMLHRTIHHVNLAHGAAVDAVRAGAPGSSIGSIHNVQTCYPSSPVDDEAARLCDAYWNRAFPDPQCLGAYPEPMRSAMEPHVRPGDLERIRQPIDWFGLNHYGPVYVKSDPGRPLGFGLGDRPPGIALTPIGWPIDADAFADILCALTARYRLPVYVLENGLGAREKPDNKGIVTDDARIAYLHAHIGALNRAVAAGADVRGYFVWSLIDNFEWSSGYGVRFGLAYVDYPTQRRIPKSSFRWYRDLIESARRRVGP